MPTSLNVAKGSQNGIIGFANTGWWGIEVKPQNYSGSFYVKGDYSGEFSVSLQSTTTGDILATTSVQARCGVHNWTEHTYNLRPTRHASDVNNTLSITFNTKVGDVSSASCSLSHIVRRT